MAVLLAPEEESVGVTAMDRRMTGRALLVARVGDVVERGHRDVTGDAQFPLGVCLQHEPVGRAVRRVAGHTPFDRGGRVLVDERSALVDVTRSAEFPVHHGAGEHGSLGAPVGVVA